MSISVTVSVVTRDAGRLVAPQGLSSPAARCRGVHIIGAARDALRDDVLDQTAVVLRPDADEVVLRYVYDAVGSDYPEVLFAPHQSRYVTPTPA
ncbi:MAG: hypothetical protein AAF727_06765 [Pseudomonadota bacterium]